MSQQLIETLVELEKAAAESFWQGEDRTAWRDDLLRQSESRSILSIKTYFAEPLLKESAQRNEAHLFPVWMWDHDLLSCFERAGKQAENAPVSCDEVLEALTERTNPIVAGIFLRPGFWLTPDWVEQEEKLRLALAQARGRDQLIVRCGFLTHQADILMTADLGFTGVQIHAAQMDLYELQMAIELARDCRLCPIVSVANEDEMEQVIQTDAPHVAICHFPSSNPDTAARFVQSVLPKIPNNCTRLLLTSAAHAEAELLTRLGFGAAFQFNPERS